MGRKRKYTRKQKVISDAQFAVEEDQVKEIGVVESQQVEEAKKGKEIDDKIENEPVDDDFASNVSWKCGCGRLISDVKFVVEEDQVKEIGVVESQQVEEAKKGKENDDKIENEPVDDDFASNVLWTCGCGRLSVWVKKNNYFSKTDDDDDDDYDYDNGDYGIDDDDDDDD